MNATSFLLRRLLPFAAICCLQTAASHAQGIHFSQFFNTPMLVSPSNTGLMSDEDYRISLQYRNQWGAVPVPFNTFMAAGDVQIFRRKNETNWLGIGGMLLTDKAGEGSLSMTRLQLNAAYHVSLSETQLLSMGFGVAAISRKINFSELIFDAQWEGFAFNPNLSNREPIEGGRSSYTDINAGISYSVFPNEQLYVKGTVAVDHVNSPRETFLRGGNKVLPRLHGMMDARIIFENGITLAPSIYYSSQQRSWEALLGANMVFPVMADNENSRLIAGAYYRLRDAIVVMAGYEYRQLRLTASYDYTVSDLGQYISHNGGFEIGLVFRGNYGTNDPARKMQCPRF